MMTFGSSNGQPVSFSSCFQLTVKFFQSAVVKTQHVLYTLRVFCVFSHQIFWFAMFWRGRFTSNPPSFIREDATVQ